MGWGPGNLAAHRYRMHAFAAIASALCFTTPAALAQDSAAPAATAPAATAAPAAGSPAPVAPPASTVPAATSEPVAEPSAAAPTAPSPSETTPGAGAGAGSTSAPVASEAILPTITATDIPGASGDAAGTPPEAAAGDAPAPGAVAAEKLPHDLSPWGMFMQADMIVKGVMLGLVFASFVTWTVWFAKSIELMAAKRKVGTSLRRIDAARSLSEVEDLAQRKRGVGPALLKATMQELHASWGAAAVHGIKERIQSRLERIELAAARDINKGTGVLATIGSTAPFVGLFGTVWGIMNSFIGISESQTTNLAIVAPGIAEALLATAFGLVAAIPAVIFYNQLARSISGYKALLGDTGAAVMRLASRDLERGSQANAGGLRAAE